MNKILQKLNHIMTLPTFVYFELNLMGVVIWVKNYGMLNLESCGLVINIFVGLFIYFT